MPQVLRSPYMLCHLRTETGDLTLDLYPDLFVVLERIYELTSEK